MLFHLDIKCFYFTKIFLAKTFLFDLVIGLTLCFTTNHVFSGMKKFKNFDQFRLNGEMTTLVL